MVLEPERTGWAPSGTHPAGQVGGHRLDRIPCYLKNIRTI